MMRRLHQWWLETVLVYAAFAGLVAAGELKSPPPVPVTFYKHIAPIVFQHCTGCHRAGEVAPFPLISYEDVRKRAKQIARVVESRVMPPWMAEPGHGEFIGARRLDDAQVAAIRHWVEQGAVEGDVADCPPPPAFTDGWHLGTPDRVVTMAEAFSVPAEGQDIYRTFVIPFENAEDQYVAAVEYRPSNRKVVHHAVLYLDNAGRARKKDAEDPAPGFRTFGGPGVPTTGGLGIWAPGMTPRPTPEGTARLLRKNSDLLLQLHFHPSGKPEVEKSSVAIYFAKTPPVRSLVGFAVGTYKIDIPAGKKDHRVSQSMTLPVDIELLGTFPHAHLICRTMKATATLPDGRVEPLIWIKDWNFDWQDHYQFITPLKLPKGTRIHVEFSYDNSDANPRNPSHPPKRVRYGEQTTDEMAILFCQAICASKADALRLVSANPGFGSIANAFGGSESLDQDISAEQVKEAIRRFDRDGDGKLNEVERADALKARSEGKL